MKPTNSVNNSTRKAVVPLTLMVLCLNSLDPESLLSCAVSFFAQLSVEVLLSNLLN